MKRLDLALTSRELENIKRSLESNRHELSELSQNETVDKAELDEMMCLIRKYRDNLDSAILELTEAQGKLSDTTLFIDKSKHKVQLDTERVGDLERQKDAREEEARFLDEKLAAQETEMASIKERFSDVLASLQEKDKALAEKEQRVKQLLQEIEGHNKGMKADKNMTVDLLAFQTKTKNELIKMGADLQNKKARISRLETEKTKVLQEKNDIESRLSLTENEEKTSRKKVEEKTLLIERLKESLNLCEKTLEDAGRKMAESENKLDSLKSKEEILKEMIKNFEGFENGVRLVMEGAKEGLLRGIIGVIAEMMEPESGYEAALETALDKKAQAIVLENKAALASTLSYLDRRGSARFIICEDIKERSGRERLKRIANKENLKSLSSFVRIDLSYEAVAGRLLEDIYVVESIDKAQEIIGKYVNDHLKFVTKEGSFIERGYMFGAIEKNKNTTSIIGRKKRLEAIIGEQARISSDIELLKKEKADKKANVEELKREIALADSALKKDEIELANVVSKKETEEAELKKINDEISILTLEIDEADEFIHEISTRGDDLNARLNENEAEYSKIESLILSSQQAIQDKTTSKNRLLVEISEVKSEISFLKNTEEFEARNLDKEIKLADELITQRKTKERDAAECEEKTKTLLAETEELEEKIKEKQVEQASLAEKLREISESKKSFSEDLRSKEENSRQKEEFLEGLRNRLRNLEIKNKERELKIINIKDRVREAYKMDIESASIPVEENTNWEETKNQIEVFRIKLEKLGTVNLVAIDEHKELQERYSFLTQQEEDLLGAKESLHKAIIKINHTTKKLFIEAFQKIQVEFKSYFRMLFGGGHAELLLMDESDILESGIEIVARPPGKKLQNLLLLSGGEKALTAIALLFAIFKVKPSPFCILDEVDAPLDESNIGRFSRILRDFLKTSQFIVITHSKKTMQLANILYGITMEEKGASKIVSVKLSEDGEKEPSKKEEVLV